MRRVVCQTGARHLARLLHPEDAAQLAGCVDVPALGGRSLSSLASHLCNRAAGHRSGAAEVTTAQPSGHAWQPLHRSFASDGASGSGERPYERFPAASGRDGGRHGAQHASDSAAALAQPTGRLPSSQEAEVDELLQKWEAMMEDEETDPMDILRMVSAEMSSEPGLPSWDEILQRGDEEEELERQRRRSREQALQEEFAEKRVRVVDRFGRSYATGKRKCSIARAWVKEGSGAITVNGRPFVQYFTTLQRRMDVLRPLEVAGSLGNFDVYATVTGGGTTGQAQALRHGISRALQLFNPDMRPALKAAGLLKRDSRIVERKKPGLAKARKSFQWVKR